jgi:glucose-1-phosphate cytidylyltransferase
LRNESNGMKVVILAGGLGTRISEETDVRPKPMVEIGGRPILWHILKIYSFYGLHDFVVCLGYKGYYIKEYFSNYFLHQADVTIDLKYNNVEIHNSSAEPWRITLVDTGTNTATGGRIKRIRDYLGRKPFMLTYGDGVADVDMEKLLAFHESQGRRATLTAVQPFGRFGALDLDDKGTVRGFREKPKVDNAWVNGGFFVLEPEVFDYIEGDETFWEQGPLETLSKEGQLAAYKHTGFWQPMDTLRDKRYLEDLWQSGDAPWKLWKE